MRVVRDRSPAACTFLGVLFFSLREDKNRARELIPSATPVQSCSSNPGEGMAVGPAQALVRGTLKPGGSLELEEWPDLPAGPVEVIIRPLQDSDTVPGSVAEEGLP
jgi:hypothetical protein